MEPTTALTSSNSVVMLELSSGNAAMVVYSITVGEIAITSLLALLVAFKVLQEWRGRRC